MLVMFVAASGFAQDSYRDAVKGYILANGQMEKMKTLFSGLKDTFFNPTEGVDLDALTNRYIDECLCDQLADMVMPMMKIRDLTEDDLRTVSALISTPEGKSFIEHQNEWNMEMAPSLVATLIEQGEMFKDGGVAENVAVNPDIDPVYEAKFRKMIETGKVTDMLTDFWNGFKEGSFNLPDSYQNWLKDNFVTIALNTAYGIMSLEDIDYGTMLYSNESYAKTQKMSGVDMDVENIQSMGVGLISAYCDWMESQGVELSGSANMMKMLMDEKKAE